MRAIKFRVLSKRVDSDKWTIVGYEQINECGNWEYIRNHRTEWALGTITDNTGDTVFRREQFIDHKDKTGREIFEGDTVISCMPCDDDKPNIYHIGFNNGTFVFYRKLSDSTPARQWNDGSNYWYSIENIESFETEIIGNIHEQES